MSNKVIQNKISAYIKKYHSHSKYKSIGFMEIYVGPQRFYISYVGNMGSSIQNSVNPQLKNIGLPSIEQIKKAYPKHKESGSPDYSWSLSFNIK